MDMKKESRKEIMDRVFKEIHGSWKIPMMYWDNHPPMRYGYNDNTDAIECDCGVSVQVPFSNDELCFQTVDKLINDLYDKVWEHYKREYNIVLYMDD